jgi:hypothetical protein
MSNNIQMIKHHTAVNVSFAEAAYQKMASVRFGVEFCCETDLAKDLIRKEQLDLSQRLDAHLVKSF